MAPMPSFDKTLTYALSNLSNVSSQENNNYLKSQHLSRKYKTRMALKLSKKMYTPKTTYQSNTWKEHLINTCPASISPFSKNIIPLATEWNQIQPIITVPAIPIFIPTTSPILATNICPYVGAIVQPPISPIIPQTLIQDDVFIHNSIYEYYSRLFDKASHLSDTQYVEKYVTNSVYTTDTIDDFYVEDLLEMYLKLPKDLFPTARMIAVDPNPIINEFCKLEFIENHTPWLLDLEFGCPKVAMNRAVPMYDVKFNSIHCKNAPDAIHPGFESCDPDFQNVLLFYYDCIISSWYKGYVVSHGDISVDNFQSWLLYPMQALGMCW